MALLFTEKIPLGYIAPSFELIEPSTGKLLTLEMLKGVRATVIMFICNHCPYVKHVNSGLINLAHDYISKGISFVAINANDEINYPEDSPQKMIEAAKKLNYPFPYLFDETQQVARDYHAVCTPDFSIFDADLKCIYRGQLDDSRPGNNIAVTGADIREVLDTLLIGKSISNNQKPSAGCSIKWK